MLGSNRKHAVKGAFRSRLCVLMGSLKIIISSLHKRHNNNNNSNNSNNDDDDDDDDDDDKDNRAFYTLVSRISSAVFPTCVYINTRISRGDSFLFNDTM